MLQVKLKLKTKRKIHFALLLFLLLLSSSLLQYYCYYYSFYHHYFFLLLSLFYRFQVRILLLRPIPRSCTFSYCPRYLKGTQNKPLTGYIGRRNVTSSRTVAHQKWVSICSPLAPDFSRIILAESFDLA